MSVTPEPAAGVSVEAGVRVAPAANLRALSGTPAQPASRCLTWTHHRVRSRLRHTRAAPPCRAGGALATRADLRRHRARAGYPPPRGRLRRRRRPRRSGAGIPGIGLVGVDIEQKQLEFAREHLRRAGVEASLVEGNALALPFDDGSFDHVWMMWLLEHIADPPAALREARRVLGPGGRITAIEVDYATAALSRRRPRSRALFRRDGPRYGDVGVERCRHTVTGLARRGRLRRDRRRRASLLVAGRRPGLQARYAADVMESAFDALAQAAGRDGRGAARRARRPPRLAGSPARRLGWVMHKSAAVR